MQLFHITFLQKDSRRYEFQSELLDILLVSQHNLFKSYQLHINT